MANPDSELILAQQGGTAQIILHPQVTLITNKAASCLCPRAVGPTGPDIAVIETAETYIF